MISRTEAAFQRTSLLRNSRSDGRSRLEYRRLLISTGVAPHASGSARVTLGPTEVMVGCNLETVDLDESIDHPQLIEFRVQVAKTSSISPFTSTDDTSSLTDLLTDVFSLRISSNPQLIITPRRKAWHLFVDVEILSGGTEGGNLNDLVVLAVKSALSDLRIPKTTGISYSQDVSTMDKTEEGDMIKDMVTSSRNKAAKEIVDFDLEDYGDTGEYLQDALKLPLAVTLNLIDDEVFVDATREEELSTPKTRLLVACEADSDDICAIKQEGEAELGYARLRPIVKQAVDICSKLQDSVNSQLKLLRP